MNESRRGGEELKIRSWYGEIERIENTIVNSQAGLQN